MKTWGVFVTGEKKNNFFWGKWGVEGSPGKKNSRGFSLGGETKTQFFFFFHLFPLLRKGWEEGGLGGLRLYVFLEFGLEIGFLKCVLYMGMCDYEAREGRVREPPRLYLCLCRVIILKRGFCESRGFGSSPVFLMHGIDLIIQH